MKVCDETDAAAAKDDPRAGDARETTLREDGAMRKEAGKVIMG